MNFGLGLVLSFTDNATAGINGAVNSLNQLSESAGNALSSLDQMASLRSLSIVADQIGSSFLKAGGSILSAFGGAIQELNQTGSTLMYAEIQFDKLYNRVGAGKEVLKNIQDYAKRSIFEFEDLIPSVVMLKANGIEAFDAIGKSIDGADRNLMDYAADLAAFNPQMRNMYGTGIKAAMGALNEYIAEGNAKSLKSGASLDITGILGEDKGKTIEERTDQVVRLMEKLNMVGMVSSMEGRPEQMLSNMGDVLFDLKGRIANSGVYEEFSKLIGIVAEFVFSLSDGELQSLAQTIGSALTSIMKPLETVANKLVSLATSLKDLLIQNPNLAKFVTIGVAFGGMLLILGGIFLKFASAMSSVSLFMLTFGDSFSKLGSLIRTGSLKILGTLIPLTIAVGLLAMAWKTDFAGIKSNVTYYTTGISNSFKTAKEAVNGSVGDMITKLSELRDKNDFFSNLTVGIMKVMIFMRALKEGWNDYTLSEDTFLKARELGILPLIEAVLDLKYRFDFFKQGFIDGWREIGDKVKGVVDSLLNSLDGTFLGDLINKFTDFLQIFSGSDTQAWYDFGKSFAEYTAKAVALFAVLSTGKKIIGIISGISTVLKPLLGLIVAHPVVAIIIGVITALGILYAKSEDFRNLVSSVLGTVMELLNSIIGTVISIMPTVLSIFSAVAKVLGTIFSVVGQLFALILPTLLELWNQLGGLISDVLPVIADLISTIVDAVMSVVNIALPVINHIIEALKPIISTILNIISTIIGKLVPVIKSIVSIVSSIIKAIVSVITPIITVVMQIIDTIISALAPIIDVILQGVGFIINIILGIVQVITSVIQTIVAIITSIIQVVMSIINAIVQAIMVVVGVIIGIVTTIIETITSIISAIIGVVQGIWDGICNIFSNAVGFFSGIFTSIAQVISNVFNGIASFFSSVWEKVVSTFNTLGDTISGAIRGAINLVVGGAVNIINGFIKAINFAIGIINAIPGVHITKLTELEVPQLAQGGVVDKPTTAIIGEAGTEAVVPLENNTQWLGKLASMITTEMAEIRPTNNLTSTTNNSGDTNKYMTNNNNTTHNISGDTDNSINFSAGAIQITANNSSDEEAEILAKKIMNYIKRQQELDRMTSYA